MDMTPRRIAALLLAGALAAAAAPALAQGAAEPAPKRDAAPKKPRATKKAAKPAAKAAAAPSARSPILGGGEGEAASLERRRKAFFAPKPDDGAPEEASRPTAGVTLGGSGGLTPGMGFKF